MFKCRLYFSTEAMQSLYICFSNPQLTYCVEVWGDACQSYWKRVFILQKRAIKMMIGAKKLDHILLLFYSHNRLQIKEIYKYIYCVQLFVYRYHHDCLPNVFYDFCVKNNSAHDHQNILHDLLHVPLIRTQLLSKTTRVTGVFLDNYFHNLIGLEISYERALVQLLSRCSFQNMIKAWNSPHI